MIGGAFWALRALRHLLRVPSSPGQPVPRKHRPAGQGRQACPRLRRGQNTSFGPVKQIEAGVLNVGYVEVGHADGQAVVLMHGFPYDIHSYVEVAPLLAAESYRVIGPYFRGYGTTTFLSSTTPGMSIRRRSLSTSWP
jgi:hypothetical protein